MVIDCCTYNSERDIWDIHYNVLKDHVDQFIVVEFDKTFSGKPKESTFPTEKYPDVKYYFHTEELYSKYKDLAESSPNTKGAEHWKREFMQKESIKDALTHLNDDDIVFIGDVDEIWKSHLVHSVFAVALKIKLDVYTYYLNNHSSEEFWGTILTKAGYVKPDNVCLNHLRTKATHLNKKDGWHFTSMGGYEEVKKKLSDSYTEETYWNKAVQDNLERNIIHRKDFLGREFTYTIDESEWPQYLKENKDKYKHLCL